MGHVGESLQTLLIFAILLSTLLIAWIVIRWTKGPASKTHDLPKLKFRQFQALYYLNPTSWTLGELTAKYEGVGEFRFSYLGEIRYSLFKKEVLHQKRRMAKADQIEKLLLKINEDIAQEKKRSTHYYKESIDILSKVSHNSSRAEEAPSDQGSGRREE